MKSPQSAKPKTLLIAGGGTGGHVLAGVAIADAWKRSAGPDARVLFVGARGGIEEKLVPRAGYPLELLSLGSLNRVSLWRKLKTFFQLPLSFLKSIAILLKNRPDAVIGVGGYAAGPIVLMARPFSPTAILEQNQVPGLTNRWLGNRVNRVFCAFPGTEKAFPRARVQLTGNPIRTAFKPLPRAPREPFTIFVFGGSQGSVPMNTLVLQALPHLKDLFGSLRFVHQTGEKDYDRVLEAHRVAGTNARVEKFIYEMERVYAESSLLICRAGSSTLSEIAAVGRAAVLIPFPQASDNHQEKNANVFVEAHAAFHLPQLRSSGEDLARVIRHAHAHPEELQAIEQAVRAFFRPTAADDIVQALLALNSGK